MTPVFELLSFIFSFFGYVPLFTLSFFVAFYIPGNIALSPLKLQRRLDRFVLSSVCGIVFWGWQAWIFGMWGIRGATHIYLVMCALAWLYMHRKKFLHINFTQRFRLREFPILTVIIITVGVLFQLSAGWFSGWYGSDTIRFIGGNTSDNMWHVALNYQLVQNIPPYQPVMYGEIVTNYHYWGNMIIADLVRVFHLPPLMTQFQFFFLLLSVLLGLTTLTLSYALKLPKIAQNLLLFFLYFGGDFTPFILLLLGKGLNFTMGAMEHGGSFLANYPRAFSIVVLFAGMTMLFHWIRSRERGMGYVAAFLFAALVGLKINTAIFAFIGLGCLGLYFVIRRKWDMVPPLILAVILGFSIYFPVNKGAGGLVFTGFWRVQDFIVQKELGLVHLEQARVIFAQDNNWKGFVFYNLLFCLIFVVATFGTKLLGFIQTKKSLSLYPVEFHIFMVPALLINFVLGMFFIQESGGANSFNFLVSVYIMLSFYAVSSVLLVLSIKQRFLRTVLLVLIVAFTVARPINGVYQWHKDAVTLSGYMVNTESITLYEFIRNNTDRNSFILSGDLDMSFLAARPVFIGKDKGLTILESHGIDTLGREEIARRIYDTQSAKEAGTLLLQHNINYVINNQSEPMKSTPSATFLKKVYSSGELEVSEVDHATIRLFLKQ